MRSVRSFVVGFGLALLIGALAGLAPSMSRMFPVGFGHVPAATAGAPSASPSAGSGAFGAPTSAPSGAPARASGTGDGPRALRLAIARVSASLAQHPNRGLLAALTILQADLARWNDRRGRAGSGGPTQPEEGRPSPGPGGNAGHGRASGSGHGHDGSRNGGGVGGDGGGGPHGSGGKGRPGGSVSDG